MARQSKYTSELADEIVEAIETGCTDADACAIAGIDESTFYRWQQRHREFRDRVTRARPAGWKFALSVLKQGMDNGDIKAAAEFLDRTRSPYRKSQEAVITGDGGGPLKVVIERVTRNAGG